jgi:hypothetical protein
MPQPNHPARGTLRPTNPDPLLLELQRLLQRTGYGMAVRADGYPSAELWAAVEQFQLQHVGPSGAPLAPDGVVGPATWWALDNPSGKAQRSGYALALPLTGTLKPLREALMVELVSEYRLDVAESPDGSNRGKQIDGYWGNTGLLGLPWCCALVSEILRRALKRYPLGAHFTSVAKMVSRAQELGLITRYPRPFDIFCQVRSDGTGHCGFASVFDPGGSVFGTFEGNVGNRFKHGRRRVETVDAWIDVCRDGQAEIFRDLPELDELEGEATR